MSWLSSNWLSELVAPRNETQLDRFRAHWMAIKKFYMDREAHGKAAADVATFHDAALPEHFVALVRALVDEEAAHGSAFEGPCMEAFLAERMFDALAALGVHDAPPGTRKLLLTLVAELLGSLQQSLLQHNAVHKGVTALIVAGRTAADAERSALVDLIAVTLRRLAARPELVGFFFGADAHQMSSEAPVFHPLHALLPLLPAARGSVARRAAAALCSALRLRHPGVDSYVGERSRVVEPLAAHVARAFARAAAAGAAARQRAEHSDPDARDAADELRRSFAACNDVLLTEHPIGHALLEELHKTVFAALVGPALLKRDEHDASVAALLVCDMLDIARGPLLDALVELLLGDAEANDGTAPDSLVWVAVCKRINAPYEITGRASLQLAATLVSVAHRRVLDSVARRRLVSRAHLATMTSSSTSLATGGGQAAVTSLLRLFPGLTYGSNTEYAEYLADARLRVRKTRNAVPPQPAPAPAPVEAADKPASDKADAADDGDDDGECSATLERLVTPRRPHFRAGALLEALYDALESCTKRSYEYNLFLTSVFAALAAYDDELLNDYLLNPNAPLQPGVRSLCGTLNRLAKEAERRFEAQPELLARMAGVRQAIESETAPSGTADERDEQEYLRAVVVLTEFGKEIAALCQVKQFG